MTGSDGWGDDRPGGRRLRFSLDRKYAHHDRDEHEYEHQKGESRFIHPPSWQGECEQTGANIDEEGHRRLSRLILSESTCSCRNRHLDAGRHTVFPRMLRTAAIRSGRSFATPASGMQRQFFQYLDPSLARLIDRDQSCGQRLRLVAAVGYLTLFQQLLEHTAE